jgi:hypothetical protein
MAPATSLLILLLLLLPAPRPTAALPAAARLVRVSGDHFVETRTGATIVLGGPNVVVKASPFLPAVSGDTVCNDVVDATCAAAGNCSTCSTFNQADVDHIKARGWNFIRLGVVWAGAQPRDENALDPDFLQRLHALLDLTDRNGLHVMLDDHGDMVGSLGCGNGAPAWFQQKAPGMADLLGKPLHTDLPYSLVPSLDVQKVGGYDTCGDNATRWAAHAGDPNYMMLNECCLAMNAGNPGGLGYTTIAQKTMDYTINPGPGRDDFVRYWRLMAEAVKDHPSASFFELMNEPMTIHRKNYMDTWKACADAIHAVVPDAAVSICDIGEGSVLPSWLPGFAADFDISSATLDWIKSGNASVFYAWHYGDEPTGIKNMQAITEKWGVPTFGTETGCTQFEAARAANISHSYWHYSAYCNFPSRGKFPEVPVEQRFGGCILGWGSGDSSKCP